MIINNICGGLGNQLFQIAACYSLAKNNNDTYAINYNLQHNLIQGNTKHKYKDNLYRLTNFIIAFPIAYPPYFFISFLN